MTRSRAVQYRSMVIQSMHSKCVRTADASACGRRSAVIVGSADWQRTDFFIQRSRCCDHNEYSVKILHAVRSAITAIAELLVVTGNRSTRPCVFILGIVLSARVLYAGMHYRAGRVASAILVTCRANAVRHFSRTTSASPARRTCRPPPSRQKTTVNSTC